MFKKKTNSQNYWNERSFKFANYYENPTRFDLIFRKAIFRRFNRVLEVCKKFKNPTVLDIGSGPGINCINLLKHSNVKYVTGIDFAPRMNDYANDYAKKHNLSNSCHFIEGDFVKYDRSEQLFDISIALGVFDYIDNPQEFILKIEEFSKKAFVISWPNGGNLRMFLRKLRYTCPVYPYSENQIRKYHDNCKRIKEYKLHKGSAGWVSVAYLNKI
jgi:SAM-dependent methyltransferase